jgi:uncharacterized protein
MIDVVVYFFLLGVFARLVKSDLKLPEALYETLSIYLLLAIGLKGGIELSKQPLTALAPQVAATMALGLAIPFAMFPLLRLLRFNGPDSAAVAAHYGSVSVVTFAVATTALNRAGIAYESHAALWVAVMEAPGLIAGILLARWSLRQADAAAAQPGAREARGLARAPQSTWGTLAHDVFFGKSVLLLIGGLVIGAVAGEAGTKPIQTVFVDPFKGVLALFLLELGLVAGARLGEVRRFGTAVLVVGIVAPPILALAGLGVALMLELSVGGTALLATLAASASYIAAPTAMRIAVPQANAALSITCALGITFPFNLVIGIPMYIRWAQALAGP